MADDDDDMDMAQSFRRLVRALEKQAKTSQCFYVELSTPVLRQRLGEHAAFLRARADLLDQLQVLTTHKLERPEGLSPELFAEIVRHGETSPKSRRLRAWADRCVVWAALLTSDRVVRFSTFEWEAVFPHPDANDPGF